MNFTKTALNFQWFQIKRKEFEKLEKKLEYSDTKERKQCSLVLEAEAAKIDRFENTVSNSISVIGH